MSSGNLRTLIWQKSRSVRVILTFWYSLVLLAALMLFGYGAFVYLRQLQEVDLQRNLTEEVDWIASLMDLEKGRFSHGASIDRLSSDIEARIIEHFTMNPRNFIVILTTGSGDILFQSRNVGSQILLPAGVPSRRTSLHSIPSPDGESVLVAARRVDPFTIQVAYTERITQTVLEHLLSIFSVMVPVALFVGIAGGWLLSGIALRPIREISQRANRITAENLSQRIPPRTVNDELGELIATMNTMIERLQVSFEQMRQFSMDVAHELKTPLTILKGEAELALIRPVTPDEAQRLTTSYLEETVRMSRVVEDLLTLAKADAKQLTLEHQPVPIDRLIRDLYEDAQILAVQKELTVELSRNEPGTVLGDAVRLHQLFRAILSNAVQYTDVHGVIRMGNWVEGTRMVVQIDDTGIGIPPDSLDRIFQRFYRVDEARSRARGGSGLGLAIAKWIAEAHNGSIAVRSTLGKGTILTVTLPLSV